MRTREREREFHDFFVAEHHALQRFATMLTGDPVRAADLAQEAFVRMYQRWGSVRRDDPAPYARRIVVNLIRSEHRRAKVRELRPVGSPAAAPDHSARIEDWLHISTALKVLSPIRRATIVLRYYEDLSERQISAVLDRPVNTVKSDLRRGLAELREVLQPTAGERA
jgi:RNA polymerase sigma-70 factor (sigma-E family)